MLVCENINGERVNITTYEREELKLLSKNDNLICPECKGILIYCHGNIRVPYFKHHLKTNCNLRSETEEHRNGKIMFYNYLKETYPNSYVDMEYRILETNQRADVICIHPSGEREVYEVQCSPIPSEEWIERHTLYQSAGIKDFWVLGKKIIQKEAIPRDDYLSFKFATLAQSVGSTYKYLVHFNTQEQNIYILYPQLILEKQSLSKGNLVYKDYTEFPTEKQPQEFAAICKTSVNGSYTKETFWFTKKIESELLNINKQKEKIREERARKAKDARKKTQMRRKEKEEEKERKRENEERKKRQIIEQTQREVIRKEEERERKIANRRDYANKYLNFINKYNLSFAKEKMKENEVELFNKMNRKHQFNDKNFPGIFYSVVNFGESIKTPIYLWQFWIYHSFIYKNKGNIHLLNIIRDFNDMRKAGYFRLNDTVEAEEEFKFAIEDYLDRLHKLDILTKELKRGQVFYKIKVNQLPRIENVYSNKLLSKGFSIIDIERASNISNLWNLNLDEWSAIYSVLYSYTKSLKNIIYPYRKKEYIQKDLVEYILKLYATPLSQLLPKEKQLTLFELKSKLRKGRSLNVNQYTELSVMIKNIRGKLNIPLDSLH
ncbi:competence protein CoiA family protein [Priestia filamentosa]|uniref:competence protein CoiA n=1 Tax=Priestia filamentosa TaxID=1402861 RepID=UPI00398202B2